MTLSLKFLLNKKYELINILIILIILGNGVYMYLDGERVPNLSILICGFFGYNLSSNIISNSLINTINFYFLNWNNLLKKKKVYWLILKNKCSNIYFLKLILLYFNTIVINSLFNNFLLSKKEIKLYYKTYIGWCWLLLLNIKNIILVEVLLYKYFEIILLINFWFYYNVKNILIINNFMIIISKYLYNKEITNIKYIYIK